jgi:hypothetical protein
MIQLSKRKCTEILPRGSIVVFPSQFGIESDQLQKELDIHW